MLLTIMLNLTLFTSGPFPCPTRLMQHLRAPNQELRPGEHVEINRRDRTRFLLKDKQLWCARCEAQHYTKDEHAQLCDKTNAMEWFNLGPWAQNLL